MLHRLKKYPSVNYDFMLQVLLFCLLFGLDCFVAEILLLVLLILLTEVDLIIELVIIEEKGFYNGSGCRFVHRLDHELQD